MDPDFAICPYNPSHRVLKLRLQCHILRCRKNYTGPQMKPCPFNATHLVHIEDYMKHVLSCSDTRLIEGHRFRDIHDAHGDLSEGRYHFPVIQDEDWESPELESSYCSATTKDNSNNIFDDTDEDDDECCLDYDENEEPLQGFFYRKRNLADKESSINKAAKTKVAENVGRQPVKTGKAATDGNDGVEGAMAGMRLGEVGAGRGKLLRLLEKVSKQSRETKS